MGKKKTALKILWLVFVLAGLACSLIPLFGKIHKDQVYKREIAEASLQAVQYVRDKYGIEPELVDITEDAALIENREPSVGSVIPMKANGREFYVKTAISSYGVQRADSYQWNEIEAAIASEIEKLIPGGEAVEICAYNKLSNAGMLQLKNVFSEYYDGGNLEELMKDSGGNVEMVFPNVDDIDISLSGLREKLLGWGLKYKLTVFDTAERAKEFAEELRRLNEERSYYLQSGFGNYAPLYRTYAPYIIGSLCYYDEEKGGAKTISYDLQSYDDFKYGCFPTHLDDYAGSMKVGISCGESGEIAKWFGHYDEQNAVGKPLSDEYILENGYGEVVIYYPLENFEGMDIDKVGLAWFIKDSYITNNRDIVRAEVCGDYAVFSVSASDDNMSFMLVDLDGQEDYVPEYKRGKS